MAKRKAARALRRRRAGGQKEEWRSKGSGSRPGRGEESRKPETDRSEAPDAAKTARKARKPAARARAAKRRPANDSAQAAGGQGAEAGAAPGRANCQARPAAEGQTGAKPRARRRDKLAPPTSPPSASAPFPVLRKPPGLDRERRIVLDEDDIVQSTPPSSLDLDRSASAVRTGRRGLKDRFDEHTETSPALTAGDVDADWESAYSVGDEAPGGDNPTPDQDIVDDIGKAVGVEYQDNEELKGEEKIAKRDKNRWELDPASSDDWDDR